MIAEIATLPICTVKTNYQNNINYNVKTTIKNIYNIDGVSGFFKASSPAIISQVLSTSIKFSLYEKIKKNRKTEQKDIFNNSLNGMVSGILGSLITHPIDTWKVFTQQSQSYSNHIKSLIKDQQDKVRLVKNLVTKGFYPGFAGSIGKNIALYSTLFPINDFYKSQFNSIYVSAPLTTITVSLFVQPFDYYKVVKMTGGHPKYFFRGFWLMLARSMPHFTITMVLTDFFIKQC
jgi:hypothetical protein